MKVWHLALRELREQSRQGATYHLRLLGGVALLAAGLLAWGERGLRPQDGAWFFDRLHSCLFWSIWCVVPLMTADCISRERREGTLGLHL